MLYKYNIIKRQIHYNMNSTIIYKDYNINKYGNVSIQYNIYIYYNVFINSNSIRVLQWINIMNNRYNIL